MLEEYLFPFATCEIPDTRKTMKPLSSYDRVNPLTTSVYLKAKTKRSLSKSPLELPADIIVEIFSWLHPLDLRNLTFLNKYFNSQIRSTKFAPIWRAACRNHGMPELPSDISPAKWTYLLFGPSICYECGIFRADPCFISKQRLCHTCISKLTCKVVTNTKNKRLSLIKHLTPELGFSVPGSGHVVRRKSDYDGVTKLVDLHLARIKQQVADAKEEFVKWRKDVRESVVKVEKIHVEWKNWYYTAYIESLRPREDRIIRRLKEYVTNVRRRLTAHGYLKCDLYNAEPLFTRDLYLAAVDCKKWSERKWKRIEPIIDYRLSQVIKRREELEKLAVFKDFPSYNIGHEA